MFLWVLLKSIIERADLAPQTLFSTTNSLLQFRQNHARKVVGLIYLRKLKPL